MERRSFLTLLAAAPIAALAPWAYFLPKPPPANLIADPWIEGFIGGHTADFTFDTRTFKQHD